MMSWRRIFSVIVLLLAGAFLFVRLGHTALWDDEAITALLAEGILRSGDTSVTVDHNIVGYGSGLLLRGLHDRSTPPLPSYLAAPSIAALGATSLAARLPSALLGLLCIALLLRWLHKASERPLTWLFFAAAVLGNVSLFLYFRNCRYYAPAVAFSVTLAYCYVHRERRRNVILATLASIALMASNYVSYIAIYVVLTVDYLAWGRRQRPLPMRDWLILLIPQAIAGGVLVSIWNPLATGNGASFLAGGMADRLIVLARSVRELNACEFGALPLLLAAPMLYPSMRNIWLLRAPAALGVYLLVMALIAPTPLSRTQWADIRYYAPIIPLCIAIEVMALSAIATRKRWLAVGLAVIAFGTNILQFGFVRDVGMRSTIALYVGELIRPPSDPYSVAADWINAHLPAGTGVVVSPNHATYPLMFHAPRAVYAWQFDPADAPPGINPIHLRGRVAPDYAIVFGPSIGEFLQHPLFARYDRLSRLGHYWQDRHRPELIFHSFAPIRAYDIRSQDIYVLKSP